jgi:serine/threonine protein phosphatase PrpC
MAGEVKSGDYCVVDAAEDTAILAVIDGVGHGEAAASAAKAAALVLEATPDAPLRTLLDRCHEQLRTTRGAAMTIVRFDAPGRTLAWLGTGNIKSVLLRRSAHGFQCVDLLTYSGVVGSRLPNGPTSMLEVTRGDVLVLATDGLDTKFIDSLRYEEEPQTQADRLLASYGSASDDALVLVARLR